MATLAIKDPTATSGATLVPITPTAVTGDAFSNTGKELLLVDNGSAGSVTVTIERPTPSNYGEVTDVTVTVAAGAQVVIGPFPQGAYNDAATGLLTFVCSAVTDVTVSAIKGR